MNEDESSDVLNATHCEPCKNAISPLTPEQYEPLLTQLKSDWEVVEEKCLVKTFSFPDFQRAVDFVNRIAVEAEKEQHHPDIELSWGKVVVRLWTHKIGGLSRNDFILAAHIDALLSE